MGYGLANRGILRSKLLVQRHLPMSGRWGPHGADNECKGFLVFSVRDGNLDDTDLSGVNFALFNHFPSNLTAGNWKVGIVIDNDASDDQAQAIETITRGDAGGPFGDLANFYGEFLGVERDTVTYTDGDNPSASVGSSRSSPSSRTRAAARSRYDGSPGRDVRVRAGVQDRPRARKV